MDNAIKAVLFDVDDTLFDREAAQGIVLKQIVARFPGVFGDLEMERIAAAFEESDYIITEDFEAGAPSEGIREARSRLFLRLLGIREDCAGAITAIYVNDYPKVNAPVPGAVPVVRELSRRFRMGAVSNGLPDVQYQKLETIGLRRLFSCIILSEEIGVRKPDPRIFSMAVSRLGVAPSECLHTGDSFTNDVAGARAAGMMTCWLNRNGAALPDGAVPADLTIGGLEELVEILKKNE
jgi:putative hydrolase of the HAD superfamily